MTPPTSSQSSTPSTRERLTSSLESRFELSQNYYERLNTEYRMAMLSGNLNADTIREIESRTRPEDFERTLPDRFSKEAFQWRATKIFHRIANSWLGRVIGLQAALTSVKQRVMSTLTSPFHTVRDSINEIKTLPGLSNLDFSSPESLNRSQAVLGRLGRRGQLASDMLKLQHYLEQNPQISANASEEDLTSEQFWNAVLDRADITENRTEIIQIVTGQKTTQEVFTTLETSSITTGSDNPETPDGNLEEGNENQSESAEEIPDGMIRLSELRQRTIENTKNLGERIMIQVRLLENNSQVFTYTAAGIFLRNYGSSLVSIAGSTTSSMANASVRMFQIARMTAGATIRTAGSNPLMFSTAMFGGAALALYLADNVETDPYVPENPRVAARMIYERLQNNPQWQEMTSQEPFSNLTPEQIQEAIENSLDPERFNSYIRSIPFNDVTDTVINFLSLSEHEVINQANNVGYNNLHLNIQNLLVGLDDSEKEEILTRLSYFELYFVNNNVSQNLLQELAEFLEQEPLSIKLIISEDNKRIQWYQMLEGQQISEIQNLMVNPNLSHEEQLQVARSFTATSSLLSSPDIFVRGGRESLNRLKERFSNSKEQIENGEYSLLIVDRVGYLVSDSTTILRAPIDLIKTAWDATMEGSLSMALNEYAAVTAQGLIPILAINAARALTDRGSSITQRLTNILGRTIFWPIEVGRQQFYLARNLATEMGRANLKARFNEMLHTNRLNRGFHAARGTAGGIEQAKRLRTFVQLHVELSRTVDTFGSSTAGRVTSWDNSPVNPVKRARLLQLLSDLNPGQQVGHLQSRLTTYASLRELRDTVTAPEFNRLQREGLLRTDLDPRLFQNSTRPADTSTTRPTDSETQRPADTSTTRPTDAEAPRSRGARRYAGRAAFLGALGIGAGAHALGERMHRETAVSYEYWTPQEPSIEVESSSESPESSNEVNEEEPNSIRQKLYAENQRLLQEYNQITTFFDSQNFENIKNKSENELQQILQELQAIHLLQMRQVIEFVTENKTELTEILTSENQEFISIGLITEDSFPFINTPEEHFAITKLKLQADNNRLFLEQMNSNEFAELFWLRVNMIKGSIVDQALEERDISINRTIANVGAYMIPVYGTTLDFRDARRERERGNYREAAVSYAFGTMGALADAAFVIPVAGTVAGAAIKGTVASLRATRALVGLSRSTRALDRTRNLANSIQVSGSTQRALGYASVGIGAASVATASIIGISRKPYHFNTQTFIT